MQIIKQPLDNIDNSLYKLNKKYSTHWIVTDNMENISGICFIAEDNETRICLPVKYIKIIH